MAQTLGIIDLVWRGRKVECESGATYRQGGIMNNVVLAGRRAHRAQQFQEAQVTATVPLKRGQRWQDIYTPGEGELQVVCDTGQTFVHNDAFLSGDLPQATGGEGGKIQLTWSASAGEEIIG